MSDHSREQIRDMAKSILGREIALSEIDTFRSRLPYLVRAKEALRAWSPHLGAEDPALIHRLARSRRG